jgi:ABC-2 type transport system ATP-binding protein
LISSHILTELAEMCDKVGIIEKGQMLAVGSVNEILHAHHAQDEAGSGTDLRSAQVSALILSDFGVAREWLEQQPDVFILSLSEQTREIQFRYPADLDAQADLLRRMIHQDLRIARFSSKQTSLEEVFLKVTKGRVQ